MKRKKKQMERLLLSCLLFLGGMTMIVPFLWTLSASFKLNSEIFEYPIRWIPRQLHFENYITVWTRVPFLKYYLNTVKLTVIITLGQIFTCSLAAYSFSKIEYPGRDKIFFCYLATMMVPWHAVMIPQFLVIKKMGLYNTHMALIFMGIFSAFGVFLLRQSMLGISGELSEAARIDGCGEFRIYGQIILPLCKPALATLTVFEFNFVWNDYMGPMIYLDNDNLKTIQIGLASFKSMYSAEYHLIMAGSVCALIPMVIVFVIAQKFLIQGMTFSGLKG